MYFYNFLFSIAIPLEVIAYDREKWKEEVLAVKILDGS
jgi:hypothetical protein